MKQRVYHIICIIGLSIWIMGCGNSAGLNNLSSNQESDDKENSSIQKKVTNKNQNKNNVDPSGVEIPAKKIDTLKVKIDTSFAITGYELAITKDIYDASHKKYTMDDYDFNPVTIYIINKTQDSIVFKQKFEENQFVKLFSFKEHSIHYISLSNYSGGSGFLSTIYQVNLGEHPSFTEILDYNELSFYTFSKDGSELLLMQGNWEMSEAEDESHFSDHRYNIGTKNLSVANGEFIDHGTSKQKYPSYDYEITTEMLIQMINKKEPELFKNINLNKYATQ